MLSSSNAWLLFGRRILTLESSEKIDSPNASSDALATELPGLYGQQGRNLIQPQSTVSGTCSKPAVHQRTRPRLYNIIVLCYVIITLEKDINPKFSLHIKLNLLCTRRDHTL